MESQFANNAMTTETSTADGPADLESQNLTGEGPDDPNNEAEKVLRAIFADRLTQIIDRRVDVIRKGRGRIGDFADKFQIHYTTAFRLMNGTSLPGAVLLCQIADAFDVTESWLLGRGVADIDKMIDEGFIKIHLFSPRGNDASDTCLTVPASIVPSGLDSAKLLYVKVAANDGLQDDAVIIKVTPEAQDGKIHLIYDPADDTTVLRQISVHQAKGKISAICLKDGSPTVYDIKDLVFGETKDASKLSIVGPVALRISCNGGQ